MKTAYGISRTRDKKGVIIKRDLREFVNCIHTMAGAGWETMEILVFVVYETEDNPNSENMEKRGQWMGLP